jgi:Uma2 family endonuclease
MKNVILPVDDPSVELVDGIVIDVTRLSPWHAAVNMMLPRLFFEAQVNDSIRGPAGLGEMNEPIPDILMLEHRRSFYGGRHPNATDTFLIVEVADSALDYVRVVKVPLYARFGVRDVWVVDLKAESMAMHRDPVDGVFGTTVACGCGDSVSPDALPQSSFAVNDMIGRGRGTPYD